MLISISFAALRVKGERVEHARYFHNEDELLHHQENTSVLSKMWGATTAECLEELGVAFSEHRISFEVLS
jgi:hypothetical protein